MRALKKVHPQSGVVPFLLAADGQPQYVLITNKANQWIFPKGLIEPGMAVWESAQKEAFEEAGLKGAVVSESIGQYEYEKWMGLCIVDMFLMRVDQVLDVWEESRRRQRRLYTYWQAREIISPQVLHILEAAHQHITVRFTH